MERSSLIRWLLIGAALFLFLQFGLPAITGETGNGSELQPFAGIKDDTVPPERKPETLCDLQGNRFRAQLSTQGASLEHLWLEGEKYHDGDGPLDLVTTSIESVMPLRTNFREPSGSATQVAYDDFDWTLESQAPDKCVFVYEDDSVALRKTIAASERPFELNVDIAVTNKADEARKHRLTVEQTSWRTAEETEGSLGRVSPWLTQVEAFAGDEMERLAPDDFEPGDFEDEAFTSEKWWRAKGDAAIAAVSSTYFTKAVFPVKGPATPAAETQIEQVWDQHQYKSKEKDPNHGHIYRARLNYGIQELAPGATASYEVLAYVGPKERDALKGAGGGAFHADQLLDLGMFGWIGKVLISYLYILFGLVKSWGIAICLLTITVKVAMFPLSIGQIKSSMAMRKLKPQMDELNEKYKDDATQRGLAMQELWRKNNVTNPMLGCLPMLLQMPIWFALYTALQTAVELYHTPFLWFPDLSAPDRFYVLPILLGASSFLQQLLMPMQGDAMQQKMMKYMMPAMFTVFMLFLPAGLGIYFLTNTWLGIAQQLAVERYYKSQSADDKKAADEEESKGKARVQHG